MSKPRMVQRDRRWTMLAALLLALTAFLYLPVAGFPFLQLDDNPRLLQTDVAKAGLSWAFSNSFAWQPVTWLSHRVDFMMFGVQNARNHHLVSLLLHLANTGLLFWFLAKVTGERGASLFAAALFALHPLRVESVAWVSGRGDLLAGLFVLLALESHRRGRWWAAVLFAACGMMSSPAAAPLALLLFLLDYWVLKRPVNWLETGPLALLGVIALVLRATGGPDHETLLRTTAAMPGLGGLAGQALATVWPIGLSIARVQSGNLFVGLAVGAAIAGLIWLVREPMTRLGASWFVLLILPSLLLPSVWGFADHTTYLPQMGLMMALVWAVRQWWPIAAKGVVAVMIALLVLSWGQLHNFEGTVPLLTNAIAVNPANQEARLGLGLALAGLSKQAAAAEQLATVTKARPDSELAWLGYGRALTSQRRVENALSVMDEAMKRFPQSAEVRFERGIALQNVNRVPEAEQCFIEALNLGLDARNGAIAYNNLGTYAAQRNEIPKAEKYFEQAFTLNLGFALAHRNYAMTLVAQKQLQKAIDHLQRKAVLWTNNDRLVGEYLAALMTESYREQYKKEMEQAAIEKELEKKALEKR